MRTRGRALSWAFLTVATALMVAACGSSARREEVRLITVDQELRLGALCAEEVARTFSLFRDEELGRYVVDMGTRIATRSDWAGLPFTFRVLDSEEVYAFALPGGHVFVSKGMVAVAETASELAAVLAREIAHVVERHGAERVTHRYGLALLSESLVGTNPAIGRAIIRELFTSNGILAYGREAEVGADLLALRYMERAGYDPRGMVALVERLRQLEQERPEALAKWRATHQPAKVRLRWLKKKLKGLSPAEYSASEDEQFRALKERVRAQGTK
ncbi:MAG: M48 family metalloprotease [candidate division KSB1 bacterium]|nr:M48 family metalloprotease [candidate division KSB1 bacterium]MDZ7393609.1 M48 family metalloprotease [candidate division KSB1 bacterium]